MDRNCLDRSNIFTRYKKTKYRVVVVPEELDLGLSDAESWSGFVEVYIEAFQRKGAIKDSVLLK